MENLLPFIEGSGPDGELVHQELAKDHVTIGRFEQINDIALIPDPQQLVTRKGHCALERDRDGWWIVDNGSINRTFIRHTDQTEVVQGRAHLTSGDTIRILGKITESGVLLYWELTFHDPLGTNKAEHAPGISYLEYEWIQARLFRVEGSTRLEIADLRPQEHKLIRYMDQRNRVNHHVPVMCTYEELLEALWGDDNTHTEAEVSHLVWELRRKLEPDLKEPHYLQTVKGLGYRLVTGPPR